MQQDAYRKKTVELHLQVSLQAMSYSYSSLLKLLKMIDHIKEWAFFLIMLFPTQLFFFFFWISDH